jgi:thioredoxin-related protein
MAVDDSEAAMADFMSGGGWTFPVMLDADQAAGAYGVRPIPTLFVIDGEGSIVKTIVGGMSAEDLSDLVDDLTR